MRAARRVRRLTDPAELFPDTGRAAGPIEARQMHSDLHRRYDTDLSVSATRPARERILETAGELFYSDGYRAVGVDTIIARSGVAKATLYRHFPSKDELIVAYLERSNRDFWDWFEEAIAATEDPREKLVSLFDAVARLATSARCLGCAFQATAAEFPTHDHPGHRVAEAHKRAVLRRLRGLAAEAGARDPEELARELLLLMDGAFAAARMFARLSPAASVPAAAATLIDAQLPAPKR
jgi:AcrR family transcriptional regulator